MSSGPVKIPPQQIPGPAAPAKPSPNVLITKLPAELSELKKHIEIKGEVIRTNHDGTVRIRTEKGDIDVRLESRDTRLRPGERVDIEIPPGRPPQTARVTEETQTPVPPRTAQTPVDVEIRPDAPREVPPVPATLNEGQSVRIQPLLPEEIPYPPLSPEIITASIPEKVEFTARMIAQNAQAQLLSAVSNISSQISELIHKTLIPVQHVSINKFLNPAGNSNTAASQSLSQLQALTSSQNNVFLSPIGFGGEMLTALSENNTITTSNTPINPPHLASLLANPFQAEIAQLIPDVSPAIIEPKIPPSPVIEADILLNALQKPLILQNQKAAEIPAIVVAITPQNLPVIGLVSPATGEEMFFIIHASAANLLPGSQITLLPQQELKAAMPFTATINMAPAPSYFLTPEPWPLMDEIYRALTLALPQAAHAMANVTPSPANPAQLGAAALFFITAVRGGDLTQWLGGNSVDALRRGGRGSLLSRLMQEGGILNRLASEPVSQDWRALSVPLMWENQMHKIALYYKNESQNQQKDQRGKQMRFIFDLSLDAMGKVQLDGLFRVQRLDLILRTLTPLSAPMQQDMRRIYANALGQTNITGELSFQNKPEQWVTITPEKKNLGVSV